jgi:hypothetical protein
MVKSNPMDVDNQILPIVNEDDMLVCQRTGLLSETVSEIASMGVYGKKPLISSKPTTFMLS